MVSFEEFQRKRNAEYYSRTGLDFIRDFKTFAGDRFFIEALAKDFHSRAKKKGTINIYEFGIGTGMLFVSFMQALRKLDAGLPERIIYHLCDLSQKLVDNAVKRGDSFGFNVDGIVYEGLPRFVKNADYIMANEFYDDLPAKILSNYSVEVKELYLEDGVDVLKKFQNGEIEKYIKKMPEGYLVPVNVIAREHLRKCIGALADNGYIDVFDYGFTSVSDMKEMPVEMWNNSIHREFGGQITVDVNFDFISHGLNAEMEPQKKFVEKVLKKKFEEDLDSMRYRVCKIEKEFKEETDFYHMRVKK